MLKYVPKRVAFSYAGMVARTMLAVLDNNCNVARSQATTKGRCKKWKFHWSKVTKSFVVKKVYTKKDYSFRKHLIEETVERVKDS